MGELHRGNIHRHLRLVLSGHRVTECAPIPAGADRREYDVEHYVRLLRDTYAAA